MPQLDPVVIFIQSFWIILAYLLYYFFFFRIKIFPLFYLNYKINYYSYLKLIKKMEKAFYKLCKYIFYLKFLNLVTTKFVTINLFSRVKFFFLLHFIDLNYQLVSEFTNLFKHFITHRILKLKDNNFITI